MILDKPVRPPTALPRRRIVARKHYEDAHQRTGSNLVLGKQLVNYLLQRLAVIDAHGNEVEHVTPGSARLLGCKKGAFTVERRGSLIQKVLSTQGRTIEKSDDRLCLVGLGSGPAVKGAYCPIPFSQAQTLVWLATLVWLGHRSLQLTLCKTSSESNGLGAKQMSAWGIGRRSGAGRLAADGGGLKAYVDRVTQWIPADVVSLYVLGITTLQIQHPNPNPSVALLVGGLVLAPVVVLIAAWRTRGKVSWKDGVLAGLSVLAFAFWSLVVPESGWHRIQWVASNPGWIVIITAVAGLLFGLVADPLADAVAT